MKDIEINTSSIKPKLIGNVLAGAVALGLVFGSWFTVAEYERVIVTRFGSVRSVEGPGLHFKIPFAESTSTFRVDIQSLVQKKVNTYTVDNQELEAEFTINYRVPAESVARIYKEVPDYTTRLTTMAIDRFKAEAGKINVTEIASQRGIVAKKVGTVIKDEAFRLYGLDVVDFQINDLEYAKSFREAVGAAATAKANVERSEQEKRQAQVVAEQVQIAALGQANAARETAKGRADATLLQAEAEAKSIRLKGEAEAAAIKAQAEALQQNQKLVELRKAERWDGKLPVQMLSGVVPFMNFEAPSK